MGSYIVHACFITKVLDVLKRLMFGEIETDMGLYTVHTCFITNVLDIHGRRVLAEI